MGKEWLYKGGGGGGKPSSTAGKGAGKSRERNTSSGCMNAIFHLFDIQQHHHFNFHQPSFISDHSHINHTNVVIKGVEAPRNSLEIEEPMMDIVASSSSKIKEEANLNIPMGGIKIKTKRLIEDLSSECSSSSPGAKTPNLVARLMGLDLLPDNSSPRPSSSSTPVNPISNLSSHHLSRSLPTTPRISTASRRSTESDYHHRLSLQINKENCTSEEQERTSQHAKQIAKQVIRENISRRVGSDITNTMTIRSKEQRRDQNLVLLKPKRSPPAPALPSAATVKQNDAPPLSCSPKLRLLEIKNNLKKPISDSPKSSPLSLNSNSKSKSKTSPHQVQLMKQEVQLVKQENEGKVKKCKRIASERYDLRLKKMQQQQEEQFVNIFENKCKKKSTPLSNHLLKKVNSKTKFTSMKKDMTSLPSTATLPQKQVSLESITQLPSCRQRGSYNTKELSVQDNVSSSADNHSNGVATTATGGPASCYSDYISKILHHSGIDHNTPISIAHWYSPSHPLHPSIFHHLETLFHPPAAAAAAGGGRKLVFDVVDELLVEILKPYINLKPWVGSSRGDARRMSGRELIGKLCEKIGSFPAADCRVLEDIDCLIDGDLRSGKTVVGPAAFEEEAEELATEIERDIVDTLVHEMASMIWQR